MDNHRENTSHEDDQIAWLSNSQSKPWVSPANKRKVSFSSSANVVISIPSIDAAIEEMWFTADELHDISMEVHTMIQYIAEGTEFVENDHQTFRGLEHRTAHGARRREENKYYSRYAVLCEQWRQLQMGVYDSIYLAELYVRESCHCQQEAYFVGVHDEVVARRHLADAPQVHHQTNLKVEILKTEQYFVEEKGAGEQIQSAKSKHSKTDRRGRRKIFSIIKRMLASKAA